MEKNEEKIAVFILTHGRAGKVQTYKALKKVNFQGEIFLLVDDEDSQLELYKELYKDKVVVFSKEEMEGTFDVGDNFPEKRAVVYARNKCFEIAEKLGFDVFIQLDDDYNNFDYRFYNRSSTPKRIKDINPVIGALVKFYKNTNTLDLAIAQPGDFIGGRGNRNFSRFPTLRRKCMNFHIVSPKRRFDFLGKLNEDVNTPLYYGQTGGLFFTVPFVSLTQGITQSSAGGLTEIYLSFGTYVKSFYSIMFTPSCVKISIIRGNKYRRIHHKINWNLAVPKILSEIKK